MFGLGFPELLIILVIILVIFGAGKLPQVGDALGKGLNKFRTAMDDKPEKGEAINATASETSKPSENEKTEKKVDKV
jgi:sec-independent protein translocase protein TatA